MLGKLRYAVLRNVRDFELATIHSISRSLRLEQAGSYRATVYIDGLARSKCREYTHALRNIGAAIAKVRGIARDENSALLIFA